MTDQISTPAPAPQPVYLAAPVAPWNVLAIVSLVTSLVGLGIVGIITGHLGLGQIKHTGEQGRGLALAGTIIGYVTVGIGVLFGILALIMAIFFPLLFLSIGATDGRY